MDINNANIQEAVSELEHFKDEALKEEIARYSKEYRESKWYREPTLRDCLGDMLSYDFNEFYRFTSSSPSDTEHFKDIVDLFTERAKEFGKSWWDEDLLCERTGYEFETMTYIKLRNIAAKVVGLGPADWHDYYEGRGV